jgi:hypothetical protein
MKLNEIQEAIIILMSNDVKVGDIHKYINLSTSSIEKKLRNARDDNDINTNCGLVGEYLNHKFYSKPTNNT